MPRNRKRRRLSVSQVFLLTWGVIMLVASAIMAVYCLYT